MNCTISNCSNEHYYQGLCSAHYRRKLKNGCPEKLSKYEQYRKDARNAHLTAIAENQEFYLTGYACNRGHNSRRFTKNQRCEACYLEDVANSEKAKSYAIKTHYNLSLEEYNELLKIQNNVCKICKKPETTKTSKGKIRLLNIDHCHKTNKIRGLLCSPCNRGIGFFKDSPELLRAAALYCEEI